MEPKKNPSPSRSYVAVCNTTNFDGYYFKKFILPKEKDNTIEEAQHYFLNTVDFTACIQFVVTYEDYTTLYIV